jgi:hypothetical protein
VWIYFFFNVEPRETQKEKTREKKRQQKKTNREL